MSEKRILEVCAFNIQSCIIAERVGAARVELCDNPIEGGTTPSYGTIRRVREKIGILLYPIIRPRSGNYFYDDDEFDIMLRDVAVAKELGCDGISVGYSRLDSTVDTDRLKRIADTAYPMGVTCNRVFDTAPDPFRALEEIIDCGCERILTSGQKTAAPDGSALLSELIKKSAGRIIIMPGAGVRARNIPELIRETGATEFHTSARKVADNPVTGRNPAISDYGDVYIADEVELTAVMQALATENS
jgi:copper homeostasis protein